LSAAFSCFTIDLPVFVAYSYSRLSAVTPGEMDISTTAATFASPTSQVEALLKRCDAVTDVDNLNRRLDSAVSESEEHCVIGMSIRCITQL
jgi:hypothetical protein